MRPSTVLAALVLVTAASLTLSACSSTDSTPAATAPARAPTPFDASMHTAATALCTSLATCAAPFFQIFFGGDMAQCEAREFDTVVAGLVQPGVTMTNAGIDQCATDSKTSCEPLLRLLGANDSPAACSPPGTLPDGAPCSYVLQCASTNCSRGKDPKRCGVCAPRAAAGGVCVVDTDCAAGNVCVDSVCAKVGGVGAICDGKHPCDDWLRCGEGVCGAALAEGAPCKNLTGDCDLYGQGLVCVSGACTKATFAKAGEDCGVVGGKAIACAAGACKPSQIKGTCFANARDGEACDPILGADCQLHAGCLEGRCVSYFDQSCK